MFKQEGFLTITGLALRVWHDFADYLSEFNEDSESVDARRRVWVEWNVRVIFESAETLFLIYPGHDPVSVDPVYILRPPDGSPVSATEVTIDDSKEGYIKFQTDLSSLWEFIDPTMGEVRIPHRYKTSAWRKIWAALAGHESLEAGFQAYIARHLKPYAGRLVAIREHDVDVEIKRLKDEVLPPLATDAKTGTLLSPMDFNLQCIQSAYPNGLVGTWAEIERRTGLSRRTINRTIQAHGIRPISKSGQ